MKIPPYETFPVLSDERILLRQIVPSEIMNIIEISFYDAKKASSEAEALQMLEKINQDYLKGESIHWGIVDKLINTLVGTCGFYRGFKNGSGELGCVLLPQYQGFGFMTKAMQLAMGFGKNNIGLKKIIAITSHQNEKAIKLLDRLGFTESQKEDQDEKYYEYKMEPILYK